MAPSKPDVIEAGDIRIYQGRTRLGLPDITTLYYGLVIRFPDDESLRAALSSGRAEFTVFGSMPEKGGS